MSTSSEHGRRVVVTGLGVFSPIGIGKGAFWESLVEGRGGVGRFAQFPSEGLPIHVAGEVRGFEPRKHIAQRKSLKVMCRDIQLGVAAAQVALADAGIEPDVVDPSRIGVDYGASLMPSAPEDLMQPIFSCLDEEGKFHFEQWGEQGMREMFPLWLLKYLPNMPACHIGILCDAQGPNNTITQAEASGNLAVGEAYRIIARGSADVMVSGATASRVHPIRTVQTCLVEELSHRNGDPAAACRPFDADRDGMVVGEGAGCLILEELEHARRRGAHIYAEIAAMGSACCIKPDGTGCWEKAVALAIRKTLDAAGASPEDVGHVNAHGVATRQGDIHEARGILDALGSRAKPVPVLALKGYFGNLGAGCGAVELIASVLALEKGVLPRSLNYETPDPECPLHVVAGTAQPVQGGSVLNLNVTRMGQASCLMVRQYESA